MNTPPAVHLEVKGDGTVSDTAPVAASFVVQQNRRSCAGTPLVPAATENPSRTKDVAAMNEDVTVVMPVYNEAFVVRATLTSLLSRFPNVIAVDDGSTDSSVSQILGTGARLVRHPINLGQGAAIQTGITAALTDPATHYVGIFDADGQHGLDDLSRMVDILRTGDYDIALGSRFTGTVQGIAGSRKALLRVGARYMRATTGLKISDPHNGLRVFRRSAAERLNITAPDFSHANQILERIRKYKLSFVEVPVNIVYSDYSKAKGQSSINFVNITFDSLVDRLARR
jgi:polyprenyl-phospho-N-acetylgalactosaminyl synthase